MNIKKKILNLLNIVSLIYSHPLNKKDRISQIFKFFFWQLNCLTLKKKIIYKVTNNFSLYIVPRQRSATANYYLKLHEYVEMLLICHFLDENDLFVDVGSNIGEYALLAAGETKCNSLAIEPVESTFNFLKRNVELNNLQNKIQMLQVGVSNINGFENFTNNLDSENFVIRDNKVNNHNSSKIKTLTLDEICKDKFPSCIKIDVEGFEAHVLEGARKTLQQENLKVVIIELRNLSIKYNFTDEICVKILNKYGFKKTFYDPFNKRFLDKELYQQANEIYVKNKSEVLKKINSNNSMVFLDGLVI